MFIFLLLRITVNVPAKMIRMYIKLDLYLIFLIYENVRNLHSGIIHRTQKSLQKKSTARTQC